MTSRPGVLRVFDSVLPSGNGYKVHLLLSQLGQRARYETVDLDILASPPETRRKDFLARNPNGRIPTVELSDGSFLPESNAILFYLAEGTRFLPSDPLARAQALQWMFFEQYSHERFVAVLKFWTFWGGLERCAQRDVDTWRTQGQAALDVMDSHLQSHDFFAGESYSIADIALFAYTHTAPKTGYVLGASVRAWLSRVEAQPGFIPIKPDPSGAFM